VHEVEKVVGLHPMHGHQAAHRGAIALVIILLQVERFLVRDLEKARDVVADALIHLLPEIEMVRIERVVEIEDPIGHMGKAQGFWLICHTRLRFRRFLIGKSKCRKFCFAPESIDEKSLNYDRF
jgi:hypothetical protein